MSEDRVMTLRETFEWLESHKDSFRDDPISLKALAHLFYTQPGETIDDTVANIIAHVKTETDNYSLDCKWTTHQLEEFFRKVITLVLVQKFSLQLKMLGEHYIMDAEKKGGEVIGIKLIKTQEFAHALPEEWRGESYYVAIVFSSKEPISRWPSGPFNTAVPNWFVTQSTEEAMQYIPHIFNDGELIHPQHREWDELLITTREKRMKAEKLMEVQA